MGRFIISEVKDNNVDENDGENAKNFHRLVLLCYKLNQLKSGFSVTYDEQIKSPIEDVTAVDCGHW